YVRIDVLSSLTGRTPTPSSLCGPIRSGQPVHHIADGDLLLVPIPEGLHRRRAGSHLALTEDHGVCGARSIGHLELRLQGPLLERSRGGDAGVPEIADEPRPDPRGLLSDRDDEASDPEL